LAWTDLDRVSFKNPFKESNVETEKSEWTGLGKIKKASSASSLNVVLHDWSRMILTRGAVDATPFVVAFSLTFSLVKN
jgi:hypothetical protein